MNARWITQCVDVGRANLGAERMGRSAPTAKRIVDNSVRSRRHEPLRQRLGLCEERPRPISRGQPLVGPLPDICDWKDVKNSETLNPPGVIKRKAIGNTPAAVMAYHAEALEAEFCHDESQVACHGSLRIWCVIGSRGRTTTAAIARKIGTNHREVAGQNGCHIKPHQMRLREPVQQEHAWPRPGATQEDARCFGLHFNRFKIIERHERSSLHNVTSYSFRMVDL